MSPISPAPLRIWLLRLSLPCVAALTLVMALVRCDPPRETKTLPPARNPEQLHLLADPGKVVGWISGTKDHNGEMVTVKGGEVRESVMVQPGNTFTCAYKVAASTAVEFSLGKLQKTIRVAPPSELPPCVFFAVDRGVYRPKQTVYFAAYLRDLDSRGEFVPRPGKAVEVLLTSETKNITAARLQLTADAQGRITGDYTFSDADPLDTYRLLIPTYKGSARLTLAEYRKAKNHLNILSERKGSRLMLRFQGRDDLERPVKGLARLYLASLTCAVSQRSRCHYCVRPAFNPLRI